LLFWRDSGRDFCLFWAALLAAAAAYTKNEGLLFFVVAVGWLCAGHGTRLKGEFIIATRAIMSKSQTQPDGGEGCSVIATVIR